MEERHHHRSLIWPILLVGAGILLLLNNLGYLPWDIWGTLWRLWPVLLIAAGLELIIGHRSFLGSLVVVLLLFGVLFGVLYWALNQDSDAAQAWNANITRGELSSVEINQPLNGAESASIAISLGAGQLRLAALPESSGLIEGQIELRSGERAEPEFALRDDEASFTLRNENPAVVPTLGQWEGSTVWDLGLTRDIPITLDVSTGAGEAQLDLSQLTIEQLKVETGVGSTQLYLPRQGQVSAQVETGVGAMDIIIPTGMAARIRTDQGLSAIRVSGKNYRQDGDVYETPDFVGAPNRIDLSIDAGIGTITVR
jgi:hypothetical protein